ncbi:unnamed protein product [Ascophyllum nodosum]
MLVQGPVWSFGQRFEFKNFFTRQLVKRILSVVTVITMVALAIFCRQTDGPKLVKRNAALVPGDRLKGGEYISFCTSIIATGCKPKYLLMKWTSPVKALPEHLQPWPFRP